MQIRPRCREIDSGERSRVAKFEIQVLTILLLVFRPAIIETLPPKVGEDVPAEVKVEVSQKLFLKGLNTSLYTPNTI